jgi:pyruvate formate lyase activating enzyme
VNFSALERELFLLLSKLNMKIAGLQKTTLIDYPGKIACTIFLHGCNFRCGFCYNPDLVIREFTKGFEKKEILEFLKKRKGKLEAVCITGGEPLIYIEEDFLKEIKNLGYLIKIDTNGSFPDKLKSLIEKKLVDYVAMDIKGNKDSYKKITSSEVIIEKIEESIKIINEFENYEFRTTIVEKFHDEEEIENLGKWMNELANNRNSSKENDSLYTKKGEKVNITKNKKPKKYFLQGFKNHGDFIDKEFKKEKNTTEKKLKELKKIAEKYFEKVEIRI